MAFVDTSFVIALRVRRDAHHAEAMELLTTRGEESLACTNYVLCEGWTYVHVHVPAA